MRKFREKRKMQEFLMATRYDKLKRNFQGMVALACNMIWLPSRVLEGAY